MSGDMANVKKSNLKVPPLKIVLSSATSGCSDRSSSTSPSSESESLDSNLTIISEKEQQDKGNIKEDQSQKDDTTQAKQDKASRQAARSLANDKSSATQSGAKKTQDNGGSELAIRSDLATTREHTSSSSQRITRSSQRAAQQNKSESLSETNGDETIVSETQDRIVESARKVKRRKGEPQDSEQDGNQQVPPQPVVMANICPADYRLPQQNSFELYRDIRKRPYKKLLQLNHVQPKVPHGFKDYLINSGPYLLDGDKIGVGLKGGFSIDGSAAINPKTSRLPKRVHSKMKYSSLQQKLLSDFQQRKYEVPRALEAPKTLKTGSPLYELFQEQERSRQKMRMQHLKERERSILAAEQEVLRAYNRAAIVDSKQEHHLSACTYFYYQERYHYIDEKNDSVDCVNPKDVVHDRNISDAAQLANTETSQHSLSDVVQNGVEAAALNDFNQKDVAQASSDDADKRQPEVSDVSHLNGDSSSGSRPCNRDGKRVDNLSESNQDVIRDPKPVAFNENCDIETNGAFKIDTELTVKKESLIETAKVGELEFAQDEPPADDGREAEHGKEEQNPHPNISHSNHQLVNEAAFLKNLQEIDDKWAKIKNEMMIRHKNESDSLFASQSMDWEWKAKEIGACDVRVSLKIDPEFVPRVEISRLDY